MSALRTTSRGLLKSSQGASTRLAGRLSPAPTHLASSRSLIVPSRAALSEAPGAKQGLLNSLLRGSESARAEGITTESHSSTVARGKYIHEIARHDVKPECVEQYKEVLAQYYPKIYSDPQFQASLTGSWEVTVGDMETFYHIWQYDGYAGYDASEEALHKSQLRKDMNAAIAPLIKHRSNWVCQEFAFWPTAEPQEKGGVYELRTYHLQPGKLLEWEQHWRRGLEARRRYAEPVGAWFSQIGKLHTVFHIWHYPSLAKRKETRDAAWQVETWNVTVSETVKLIDKMHAQIMRPLPFSPLR
ncbi:unnamed protein product [Parajaminaea phylloscopi]